MKLTSLALILFAAVGCTIPFEAGGGRGDSGAWVPPNEYSPADLANGRMTGKLGHVRGFDDSLRNLVVDTGYGSTNVEAHILGEYGWAMIAVSFTGDVGVGDLEVGATLTPWNQSQFSTDVIGCSGPDYEDFSYDSPPEDYQIAVAQDDAGEFCLKVAADFGKHGAVTGVIPLPGVR